MSSVTERKLKAIEENIDKLTTAELGRIVVKSDKETKIKIVEKYKDKIGDDTIGRLVLSEKDEEVKAKYVELFYDKASNPVRDIMRESISEEKFSEISAKKHKKFKERRLLAEQIEELDDKEKLKAIEENIDKLESMEIGEIAFLSDKETKIKIVEKYEDKLDDREIMNLVSAEEDEEVIAKYLELFYDKAPESLRDIMLESISKEKAEEFLAKKDEEIELIVEQINSIKEEKSPALMICEQAEKESPALEQENAFTAIVKEVEKSKEKESAKDGFTH